MIVGADPSPIDATCARVAEHVAAELTSDATQIVATLSRDPFFPVLVRDGTGAAALEVYEDVDRLHDFYSARVGTFEIVDTTRAAEIRTDWYALHESIATVRHVGDYQGIAPTGTEHRVHSVVLFPVDGDGIVGELEWTHVDFARIFNGDWQPDDDVPSTFIPLDRLDRAAQHDRLIDAWWRGDTAGLRAVVGNIPWASRHVHESSLLPSTWTGQGTDDELTQLAESFGALDVSSPRRLQRLAASWFSFVELAVDLRDDDRTHTIRVASLLAFENGRPTGHLAYSVDGNITASDPR